MNEIAGDVLVVMAKYPAAGVVKTRLAATVGDEAACALSRAFLADIAASLGGAEWPCVWAVSPAGSRLDAVIGGADRLHLDQRGDGLAARMHACFADLFAAGAARAVMIGADVPQLDAETIRAAFGLLDRVDVVLVPSRDGGYCLVGMAMLHDIFSGVPMSTERVLDQTRAACARLGLTMGELPEQFDVDDIADVRRLADAIDAGTDLPATAAVLTEWRRRGLL